MLHRHWCFPQVTKLVRELVTKVQYQLLDDGHRNEDDLRLLARLDDDCSQRDADDDDNNNVELKNCTELSLEAPLSPMNATVVGESHSSIRNYGSTSSTL